MKILKKLCRCLIHERKKKSGDVTIKANLVGSIYGRKCQGLSLYLNLFFLEMLRVSKDTLVVSDLLSDPYYETQNVSALFTVDEAALNDVRARHFGTKSHSSNNCS